MKKIILLLAITFVMTGCAQTKKENVKAPDKKEKQESKAFIEKLDTKAFYERVNGKKVQLVDVRTPQEYAQGHLENAENINVFDANFLGQMAKYKKDQPVYVYCRSGGRSMKAANMLKNKGYNVVNLNGGFNGWSSLGLPAKK